MSGEIVNKNESKLDLLIVTDGKDFLRKYAFRIIYALQHLYSQYTADIKRTYDVCIIPGQINFSCKKLVFMTWGLDKSTRSRITKWLGESTAKNKSDRLILTMTGDLYGNVLNTPDEKMGEFHTKYQISVGHLDQLDKWWPQMVGFLFNAPVPLKTNYKCFILKKPAKDAFIKCEDTVKTCIEYYNIKETHRNVYEGIGCNVVLNSDTFPTEEHKNCVYICDKFQATETTNRQYNKEHMLAGLLRIYSKTGVVKAPLKERMVAFLKRTCEIPPVIRTLSEYTLLQSPFILLSFILCVLVCLSNTSSVSADLEECSEYSLEMPAWWRIQTVLCFLAMALYLVSFVLVCCFCCYCWRNGWYASLKIKVCVAATICHLSAGVVCIVVLLIWWILSEDYITSFGFNNLGTSKLHASFYLFVAPVILQTICIMLCLLRDCCKRSSSTIANIFCI